MSANKKPPLPNPIRSPIAAAQIVRKAVVRRTSKKRGTTVEETEDQSPFNNGGVTREEDAGTDLEKKEINATNLCMEKFCQLTVAKKIEGLKAEFASLATYAPPEPAATCFASHKDKNRYNNIPCYDRTRVVLKQNVPPETDYIHANYVETAALKLSNRYICAQAPMAGTLNDWWRLIWQEKCKHVVMLCKLMENGKSKCADYFPNANGELKQFGAITVQYVQVVNNEKEKAYESILLRASAAGAAEPIPVIVHKWCDWPDFGVPASGMGILRLLRTIRSEPGATALIHCSAGVGRTGTVMAIELGLRTMLEGKEVNVLEIVKELRSHRACSVQTEGQYVFIHQCLFEYVRAKKLCRNELAEFATHYAAYKKAAEAAKAAGAHHAAHHPASPPPHPATPTQPPPAAPAAPAAAAQGTTPESPKPPATGEPHLYDAK